MAYFLFSRYRPQSGMKQRIRTVLLVGLTITLTLIVVLLTLTFTAGEKKVEQQLPRLYGIRDAQFQRAMGSLLGPGILPGNKAAELLNGNQIFPAMLQAIRNAQRSITFETYIYWSGEIARVY